MIFSCNRKHENVVASGYKEYVPQVFDSNGLIEMPTMMTRKHKENVIHVLKYYGADWKVENEKLLVSKKINNEILWNYTSKANDSIWLRQHE
ncbi:hypothetical protein [Flavobacterium sp. UBA7663]|uniref:hypothetical protein n=1 Tax=Flavobacterium sp. UBA7663 TaxID=1946557 RepID=UPI0025BEF018|nr:hypothetical protein [Flavobacterium sp. UBA7663]